MRRRTGYWAVTFAALLAYKWWTIRLPASWDASWTVIPGGAALAESGFDLPALLGSARHVELGPATHGNSPVTWMTGLIILVVGRGEWLLPSLHVAHIAIGAVLLRQLYNFGRSIWGPAPSLTLVVAVALVPVTNAQLGFIYLEIPQLAATMLAVNAFSASRTSRAAAWGALATSIKVSGVIAPVALAATVLVLHRNRGALRRSVAVSLPAIAVAASGTIYLASITAASDRSIASLLDSTIVTLLGTADVSFLVLISILFAYGVLKRNNLKPAEQQAFVLSLWMIVGYLSLYLIMPIAGFGYGMLPRYLTQIVPFALVAAAIATRAVFGDKAVMIATVLLLSTSLMNNSGRFYPLPSFFHSVYQEHSLAYADLLRLEEAGFKALENMGDVPILVVRNQWFRGTYPEAGFVSEPLTNMHVIQPDEDPPDRFVVLETEEADDSTINKLIESLSTNPEWAVHETEFSDGRFRIRVIEYTRD